MLLTRFKDQEADSVAGVDGAKGETLEGKGREAGESTSYNASAFTMKSHG